MNVTVAGAGMAGLVAAARARELGATVTLLEKGSRAGGSMLLSSAVVWRHTSLALFRDECPDGDERLQRLLWDRFDDAVAWLERLRPSAVWSETENPRTTGKRFDPRSLTDVLVRAAGPIEFGRGDLDGVERPLVLATGGFPVRLARERRLLVRSNPWSDGDGLAYASRFGAGRAGDFGEFYGRALPAPPARIGEADYVRLSQLYGGRARVVDERGEPFFERAPAWHENDLAQAIARRPGGTAWFVLDDPGHPRVAAAREAGGDVVVDGASVRVHVGVGVTHTFGGIRVDTGARILDPDGAAIDGLFAAGVDVGGVASGGYASGLAQALVLGLTAAESAVA